VENPGGDLHAVEGTTADVSIRTDRPLANGAILLDDGTKLPLQAEPRWPDGERADCEGRPVSRGRGGRRRRCSVERGLFHRSAEVRAAGGKITRPGRDFKATPIEEVTISGGTPGRLRA
jgi:hypothetical protein